MRLENKRSGKKSFLSPKIPIDGLQADASEHGRRKAYLGLSDALKRAARTDFSTFIKCVKPDYKFDWTNRLMIREIQNFLFDPKKENLMILVPPRGGKSELVSRLLPVFAFGALGRRILYDKAVYEILLLSYDTELCEEFTSDQIGYMTGKDRETEENVYEEIFPKIRPAPHGGKYGRQFKSSASAFDIVMDVSQDSRFLEPDAGGVYKKCASMRAGHPGTTITGRGADLIILDDLIKDLHDATWQLSKDKKWSWFESVVGSRLEFRHGLPGKTIILNTRWSYDDIPGRLIEKESEKWEIIRLPAFAYEMDNPLRDKRDKRKPGEPFSRRMARKYQRDKESMSAGNFAATHQQTPSIEGGNFIKGADIQFYDEIKDDIAIKILTGDLAYKPGQENDWTVFQVWGMTMPEDGRRKYYMIDQLRGRMTYAQQKDGLKRLARETKRLHSVHVEDSGGRAAALLEELSSIIPGLELWKPPTGAATGKMASKSVRLQYAQPMFEHHQVYWPKPENNEWINVNIDEITQFPAAKHDDTVDATTMAIEILNRMGTQHASMEALGSLGKVFE